MANEEDDLFEEEFDFVDEDDSEVEENSAEENSEENSEVEEEKEPSKPKRRSAKASNSKGSDKRGAKKPAAAENDSADNTADDDGKKEDAEAESEEAAEPPGPPADHVVHVYEYGNFKRTIQREFTDEDSIAFAEEFNRTSKPYSRRAVPDHRDEKPDPHL